MAVTIDITDDPMFPWVISSPCKTWAETCEKSRRLASVKHEAFIPAEHHAAFAPMPPFDELPPMPLPEIPEPLTRDADDDIGLKAGEALQMVNQADEE